MSEPKLILCERSNRWAAALRIALERGHLPKIDSSRLVEVRSLEEIKSSLADYPASMVLIEVSTANLDAVLRWLANTQRDRPGLTCAALLDCPPGNEPPSRHAAISRRAEISAALRQAGAADITDSPRRLPSILSLYARLAAAYVHEPLRQLGHDESLEDWALSLLPWQATRPPVG